MNNPETFFRVHAVQRMFERRISVRSVVQVLQFGEVIEDYSAEMPEPGRLIMGFRGRRPFHVVASESPETNEITIVTAYIPDPDKWNKSFKVRRV
ncbi:MAG TPA: DUF4258 domain-containing protein [Anaerolineales bacterium]|nr:DUF4258 domain-containing protein [Anaerolineales bacterium]